MRRVGALDEQRASVWLDRNTSEPALRQRLLGLDS
jgi:hypothetical protein